MSEGTPSVATDREVADVASQPGRAVAGTVAVFALTRGGAALARRVVAVTGGELWLPESLGEFPDRSSTPAPDLDTHRFSRVGPALRSAFKEGRTLLCVMAAGVVVRSLAGVIESKYVDPAVVVMDEGGRFVVPLLSGHLGGANALAVELARSLGAQAVITTSSDVQGRLGPDLLASALDAAVTDRRRLLPVAAALADGATVDLWLDTQEVGRAVHEWLDGLPGYRVRALSGAPEDGISGPAVLVSARRGPRPSTHGGCDAVTGGEDRGAGDDAAAVPPPLPVGDTVAWLVPRTVVAGVGCTRGTPAAALVAAVDDALRAAGLHPAALRALATAEAKQGEAGLIEAAASLGLPLLVVSDGQIAEAMTVHDLAENPWVRKNVGVGGVSEPAALWAAGAGSALVLPKRAGAGVTVALARAMIRRPSLPADGVAAAGTTENDRPPAAAGTGGAAR